MNESSERTNRLIHETSPYLLQHAHNPVDWYSWNDEALTRAKEENRPILLSIGYSACHWCHVMEHESFENDEIAAIMNERFVCIKVDREERPDLDHIYQTVCQFFTGTGGWPLTMFLTPDLKPFWGGTYFPPEDRYGRAGFRRILEAISNHYHSEKDKVQLVSRQIAEALADVNEPETGSSIPDGGILAAAAEALARAFDAQNGGFGSQPKFPNTMSLEIFLRYWRESGDEEYLRMALLTLRKMAEGGIYDHLGGGFHRYSTDAEWLVPHFEKMLYDNALFARLYAQAFQATGDPLLERTVRETLDYVLREMTSPEGGFYSTQDADSEGEEGKFFVWTPDEVREVLDEREAVLFCQQYGVTPDGNFEHRTSILRLNQSPARIAADYGIPKEEVDQISARSRAKLFQARETRAKPSRDDKILTAWNGLMIGAMAMAARVLEEPRYKDAAARAAHFVLSQMRSDGRLRRSFRLAAASGVGYLDDYAFFAGGLLELYETTGEIEWLNEAGLLTDTMITLFRDDASGDFFMTPPDSEGLIVRPRQGSDQSVPSGVSVAAMDLVKLASLQNRPELREMATRIFASHAEDMRRNPHGASNLISALDFYSHGPAEIVILADPDVEANRAALRDLNRRYAPNEIMILVRPGVEPPPIARGKPRFGEMTAFVCRSFSCSAPLRSWQALREELDTG
ncbi:MAG TPA: thioredoxin domain-containing protein [Armatimonadota bacterium]|nr:thioredoxin domain-containing protein [Armatimonadota bacterium]